MPPAVEATTPITNAGGPATCSDERQGRVGTTADDGVTSTGCARCRCWQGRTSAPTHFALVVVLRPLVGALTCDGELRKERLIRMSERSRARGCHASARGQFVVDPERPTVPAWRAGSITGGCGP